MNSARYVRGMPNQGWLPDRPDVLEILATAEAVDAAVLAAGSNYVYLLTLRHPDAGDGYAIYKPRRGEAPLSDFPDGTLYKREVAAYLISEALGGASDQRHVGAVQELGKPGIGRTQGTVKQRLAGKCEDGDGARHFFGTTGSTRRDRCSLSR